MLKIYISSVIIWLIIYYTTVFVLAKLNPKRAKLFIKDEKMTKKEKKKKKKDSKKFIFLLCLIPIFRFIAFLGVIYVFFCSEEVAIDAINRNKEKESEYNER